MKFDRNTVLGFLILALLFFGYFYFTNREQAANNKKVAAEKAYKDSIIKANTPAPDTLALSKDSTNLDSMTRAQREGKFQGAATGTEQSVVLENSLIRVTMTNKGGQLKLVELKNYKGIDSHLVKMGGTQYDRLSYAINTGQNKVAQTADLYFSKIDSSKNADGSQTVSFTLMGADSSSIVHNYTIRPNEYLIDFNIIMNGAGSFLEQGIMNLSWQYTARQQESDIGYEKQNTQVGYVEGGSFDYHTIGRRTSKEFDENVKWIGIRQRFFFGALVANDGFSKGKMEWTIPASDQHNLVQATSNMQITVPAASSSTLGFKIYYGPSDYSLLKQYDLRFDKLVNLGQGIYAFVRPINKFIIMPIFDFMKSIAGGNFGIAIALLTLFIRLLISPLTYKSYLSGAKMKALRPEIALLKEKHGKDQQAMSMDQMKLFREAGVNPLGGCIPALLQIPIFFALFSFFNAEIGLRGAEFLWSNDLSAYDAPIKFGVNLPILGSHLSLFNITACLTSFLISWYSMSMTPDQSNPVLKYMPYIFPVFLLFFFNNLPSALTWYYTVSNIVTLILQFIIQNYIIDHDKILAKIQDNRKKPKTKSKWQERMEQMQEQQKKLREMQQKGKR
jgi:YidC/Oxa1 family membrane protein insertase